jgi:putative membrane protein
MSILTTIAISIVIVLHILFMVLEMFLWNTPFGRKTFGLKQDYAKQSAALAANQGLYNGFLAAGLFWGLLSTGGFDALIFFLSCIIIAGIYGAITAKRSILFLQALPAAIAMTLLILNL